MKFDLRRTARLRLKRPASATTANGRVEIIDVSPSGVAIRHEFPLKRGWILSLKFTWAGKPLDLDCEVRFTQQFPGDTHYHTGLKIQGGASALVYQQLVEREIEKMKAAQSQRPSTI